LRGGLDGRESKGDDISTAWRMARPWVFFGDKASRNENGGAPEGAPPWGILMKD